MQQKLVHLRRKLASLEPARPGEKRGVFGLGHPPLDDYLGGGLETAALHEAFAAAPGDNGAAAGFAAALASRAATGRSIVWVRSSFAETETGALYGAGLAELGIDPSALILVRLRDGAGVLRAGLEAARCPALGAVIIETWGRQKTVDLTATRRLALAAGEAGTTVLLLRLGVEPRPSAARTRWQVAAGASRPLPADAPGDPAFLVTLLRRRAGPAGRSWRLEWIRDRHVFAQAAPLSRPVVSVPAGRPAARDGRLVRAG